VKTEDDDISTDDEGISNNNKSTVELQCVDMITDQRVGVFLTKQQKLVIDIKRI